MQLGKEKAAGYVEDTEVCAPEEIVLADPERTPATAELDQAAAAG
jgi:hypothetical protein